MPPSEARRRGSAGPPVSIVLEPFELHAERADEAGRRIDEPDLLAGAEWDLARRNDRDAGIELRGAAGGSREVRRSSARFGIASRHVRSRRRRRRAASERVREGRAADSERRRGRPRSDRPSRTGLPDRRPRARLRPAAAASAPVRAAGHRRRSSHLPRPRRARRWGPGPLRKGRPASAAFRTLRPRGGGGRPSAPSAPSLSKTCRTACPSLSTTSSMTTDRSRLVNAGTSRSSSMR